jgi:predicted dehydrogenase
MFLADSTDPLNADPLNVGVVGLGYWGPNLLRVLTDDPGVEVKWICDLDESRLGRFKRRYPNVMLATDVQQLLDDDDLDALVIATPVFTHYDLCSRSLLAGKHTFVEKPLADTAKRATDLQRLAAIRQRVLMCGHTFVYSPAVRAVKRLIVDGALGDIYFITSSRVNLGLHQRDVSVVWDLGPHDFSILTYWLGEVPTSVRAVGRDSIVKGIFDVAFITLNFASGIVANVELSWLSPSKLRRTVVVGSEKMVVYDDGAAEPIRLFDHGVVYEDPQTFGEYHLSYRTGDIVSPKLESHEPLAAELADFADSIRTGKLMPYHTGLAREVVRITEAASRSLELGGERVELVPAPPRFVQRRHPRIQEESVLHESAV